MDETFREAFFRDLPNHDNLSMVFTVTGFNTVLNLHSHLVELADGFNTLAIHTNLYGFDCIMFVAFDDIHSVHIDTTYPLPL